jgi:hypothetical protein
MSWGPLVEVWDVENILDDVETQVFDDLCDRKVDRAAGRYAVEILQQIRRAVRMSRAHCDLRRKSDDLTNSGK